MTINKEDFDLVIINKTNGELIRFFQKGLKTIVKDAKWGKKDILKIITYHEFEKNKSKIDKQICKSQNLKTSIKKKSLKGSSKTPKKTTLPTK